MTRGLIVTNEIKIGFENGAQCLYVEFHRKTQTRFVSNFFRDIINFLIDTNRISVQKIRCHTNTTRNDTNAILSFYYIYYFNDNN